MVTNTFLRLNFCHFVWVMVVWFINWKELKNESETSVKRLCCTINAITSIFQVLFRTQKWPSVVIFLDQSIKAISRFCTYGVPSNFFSPLSADDTYSVANHYLVQIVYQNLPVVQRDTLKSPWFPRRCSFVRQTGEEERRLIWQAAKRSNWNLDRSKSTWNRW